MIKTLLQNRKAKKEQQQRESYNKAMQAYEQDKQQRVEQAKKERIQAMQASRKRVNESYINALIKQGYNKEEATDYINNRFQ